MRNQFITNKQVSIVALSPLLDAAGNALVLQPKGSKGDEREITAETADDEIVKRVEKAGWVRLRPVTDLQPTQHAAPQAEPPLPEPVAPPPALEPEPLSEPATPPTAPEPEPLPEPAASAPKPESPPAPAPEPVTPPEPAPEPTAAMDTAPSKAPEAPPKGKRQK